MVFVFSASPRLENCCPVPDGNMGLPGKQQISNHTHIVNGKHNTMASDSLIVNGHTKGSENHKCANGQLHGDPVHIVPRNTTNGVEHKSNRKNHSLKAQNGVTLSSLKQSNLLQQRSNSIPPTANKVFTNKDSCSPPAKKTPPTPQATRRYSILLAGFKGLVS